MALIHFDSDKDPWILEYESCERLQRDIMEQFNLRTKEKRTSDQYATLSATIRMRLKQYNSEVEQLKQKNDKAVERALITSEEYERRTRQIEILQSKNIHMNSLFVEQTKINDRNQLFHSGPASVQELGTVDWGVQDDVPPISSINASNDIYVSTSEIKRTQQQLIQEQDKGLEELSKIISRQKNIAETIHTEVDLQTEIIDDLADNMERTNDRIRTETQTIRIVNRKDSTCGYWLIIVTLFFCIILVAFI